MFYCSFIQIVMFLYLPKPCIPWFTKILFLCIPSSFLSLPTSCVLLYIKARSLFIYQAWCHFTYRGQKPKNEILDLVMPFSFQKISYSLNICLVINQIFNLIFQGHLFKITFIEKIIFKFDLYLLRIMMSYSVYLK